MHKFNERFSQNNKKVPDLYTLRTNMTAVRKVLDELQDARSAAPIIFKTDRPSQRDERNWGIVGALGVGLKVVNDTTSAFKLLPRFITDYLSELGAIFAFLGLSQLLKPALRKVLVSKNLNTLMRTELEVEAYRAATRGTGAQSSIIKVGTLEELANSTDMSLIKQKVEDKIGIGKMSSWEIRFTENSAGVIRKAAEEVNKADLISLMSLLAGGGVAGLIAQQKLFGLGRLQDPDDTESRIKKQDEIKRQVVRFKNKVGYNPESGKQ